MRDIVSSTGTELDHVVYDSFGNIVTETNATNGDRFKFAGMEFDATTGQYYDRARSYSSVSGRFTTQDPQGFSAGSMNLLEYVGNGPTNAIDPSGLQPPPLPPPNTPSGKWNAIQANAYLAMTKVGQAALDQYSNAPIEFFVTFQDLPEYGRTNKDINNMPTQILINPNQNLVNVSATFVHEMAHRAMLLSKNNSEFGARMVEIQYYIELSTTLKKNVVFQDYLDEKIVTHVPETGTYKINEANLRAYIAKLSAPSAPTNFTPSPVPPLYRYPWPRIVPYF